MALIRANRTLLSTSLYASVTAIRAPGEQVFATVLQDMGFGSRTPTLKTHELLVVRSDTDVPQSMQHSSYGSPAQPVVMVQFVFDTTDGSMVEGSTSPESGVASRVGPDSLGTPTTVSLPP